MSKPNPNYVSVPREVSAISDFESFTKELQHWKELEPKGFNINASYVGGFVSYSLSAHHIAEPIIMSPEDIAKIYWNGDIKK